MMVAKTLRYFLVSIGFLFQIAPNSVAQTPEPNPASDTLLVGVAGSEPFIIETDNPGDPGGIAVEIWEDIANKRKWIYSYKHFDTVGEATAALENGSLNLLVGSVSITSSRVERMSFSQPYYQSSLSILSRVDEPNLWEKIKPLFSFKLLIAVGMFLLILAIVGTLFWFAERKTSPDQFPAHPVQGIGTGMWLAIVTMSTVGYGDKAPVTLPGRIIAGAWIVITLIFATSMVAGIASTLTLASLGSSTITNVEQLAGKEVATVKNSPAVSFIKENNATQTGVNSLEEAIEKLKNREVNAVVYDRPLLRYYLKNHDNEGLYLAKAEYYKQGYGFAFPMNNSLVHPVNRTMLELAENQEIARIIDYYLGKQEE